MAGRGKDGMSWQRSQGSPQLFGQLYKYRHFLRPNSQLLALFGEPIGAAFSNYMDACGIASVWLDRGKWAGSHKAHSVGLSEL